MTKDEALTMALEALEEYCEYGAIFMPISACDAIKEALAQPQQELNLAEAFRTELDKLSQRNYELRMENAQLKAQSQQEPVAYKPVAWLGFNPRTGDPEFAYNMPAPSVMRDFKMRPMVYGDTSPPQRKPLTYGEIDAVRSETPLSAGLEVEGRSGDYPIPYRKLFPLQSPQPQQQQPIYKYCDDGKVIFTNPEILSQRPNKEKNT